MNRENYTMFQYYEANYEARFLHLAVYLWTASECRKKNTDIREREKKREKKRGR